MLIILSKKVFGRFFNAAKCEFETKNTFPSSSTEYRRIDSIEIEWQLDPADQSQVFPLPNPPPKHGTDQLHQWSPLRQTGYQSSDPRIPRQLELSSSSTHLEGYTDIYNGWLHSILIRNLDNGER